MDLVSEINVYIILLCFHFSSNERPTNKRPIQKLDYMRRINVIWD